ncbi:hypothetical protein KI387_035212, partial [Taxus chinensis]
IVLAPMTRCSALDHLPHSVHMEFYSQRATEGGLLITKGVGVVDNAFGFPHYRGIYKKEQVEAWKPVVKAVHDKGEIPELFLIYYRKYNNTTSNHMCTMQCERRMGVELPTIDSFSMNFLVQSKRLILFLIPLLRGTGSTLSQDVDNDSPLS